MLTETSQGRDAGGPAERAARRRRAARGAEVAAAGAFFLLVLALCTTHTTDTDLWWHLATGERIVATGAIPRAEPFSFTAFGHRWIDLQWLFQVALAALHGAGGLRLLEFMRAAFILGGFALVYRRARSAAPAPAVLASLLLAVIAAQERFLTRPEIVSWLLLLAILAVLRRALDAERRRPRLLLLFAVLPALQILWCNVQGLFLIGTALVGLALGVALWEWWRGRADADRPIDVLGALAASSIACLVNPYGPAAIRLGLEQYFGHLGGTSLLSRTIAEFRPPLSGYLVTPSIVAFVILAALTLLVLLGDLPRARPFDVVVTLAMLALALRARRNVPLFALVAAPPLAAHGAALLRRWCAPLAAALRRRPGRGGDEAAAPRAEVAALGAITLATLLFTWTVATDRFFLKWPTERWFGTGEIAHYFPEESAAWIAGAGIPGNVFHSLWAGGYLVHAWAGERGVFIDGRNDPYVEDVLPAYLRAVSDPAAFEEVAARYQITAVLWPHQRALEGKAMLAWLARGHGWVLIHLDPAAAVYLRADLMTPARLSEGPFPAGRDRRVTWDLLARALDARPFDGPPIREIALGEFFSVTGDAAGAEYFYRRALDRLPGGAAVLYGYGLALERQGKIADARDAYARAARADPGYGPAHAALGALLLEAGRPDEARPHLAAAWAGGERSARLLDARARLFEQDGDLPRALQAYREALALEPRSTALLRSLAQLYLRHDEPAAALPFLTAASTADPDDPLVARDLAALLERLGRTSAALDVARDGAGRALDRLGSAAGAGGSSADDRGLLVYAAGLEARAGDPTRAARYLDALKTKTVD